MASLTTAMSRLSVGTAQPRAAARVRVAAPRVALAHSASASFDGLAVANRLGLDSASGRLTSHAGYKPHETVAEAGHADTANFSGALSVGAWRTGGRGHVGEIRQGATTECTVASSSAPRGYRGWDETNCRNATVFRRVLWLELSACP